MARVLIVDDSPSQLLGLQRIVEKLGHQVITAEDGAAGVETAKREIPDLILMDVVMPNLNGYQATRQISKDPSTTHIPVVLVTTKDQETDRVWGMRQGAKAYVTKPINEAELTETINGILGSEASSNTGAAPCRSGFSRDPRTLGSRLKPLLQGATDHSSVSATPNARARAW